MKKHLKRIISTLLITIILSSMFTTSASAISESCVENHFGTLVSNASQHVAPNIDGSCGYVAMSSLLTFYDSYWHEDFVPDHLEWKPGSYSSAADSMVNTFSAEWEYEAEYYWPDDNESYFSTYENTYLQPYLYSIGVEEGCHDLKISEYGLFNSDVKTILEKYLYDTCGFTEQQITVHMSQNNPDYTAVEAQIKEIVRSGYPVLYFGAYINLPVFDLSNIDLPNINIEFGVDDFISEYIGGHVMVAYDVENNNGKEDVKLHTGWNYPNVSGIEEENNNRHHWLSKTEFKYISSIVWLEIHEEYLPHVCSYNYKDSTTEEPLCACQIYSSHPNHTNNHIFRTNSYDSNTHFKTCHCGEKSNIQPHIFTYQAAPLDGFHFLSCSSCQRSGYAYHEYDIPTNISDTEHRLDCICGHEGTETEAHYEYSYEKFNSYNHIVYCECGQLIGSNYHVVPVGNAIFKFCIHCGQRINTTETFLPMPNPANATQEITYITDAGSYVDSNGIIYLVESDMELYLSGQLDIYALAQNPGSSTM